jgi:hypothetical protein
MERKTQKVERKKWNARKGFRLFVPVVLSVMVFSFLVPEFVSAQPIIDIDTSKLNQPVKPGVYGVDGGTGFDDPKLDGFQIVPCNEGRINPQTGKWEKGIECNFVALVATFNRILKFLLYLSIPLVVGIILYTGFQFLTAGGDAMKLEKAKKMLIPVAIGIFWVLASWLIVSTILKTFLSTDTQTELKQNTEFEKLLK